MYATDQAKLSQIPKGNGRKLEIVRMGLAKYGKVVLLMIVLLFPCIFSFFLGQPRELFV